MFKNKRKYPRFLKRLFVRFGNQETQNVGFTEDVSYEGLFIKSSVVLVNGSELVIQLTLPGDRVVNLKGHVRWNKRVPPSLMRFVKKTGMGLQLEQSPEELADFLKALDAGALSPAPSEEIPESVDAASIEADAAAFQEASALEGKEIVKAYEAHAGKDHYEVLNVTREASSAMIKRAYYKAAKRYHPDRYLTSGFSDLKEPLKALFGRMNEAYRILSSEEKRRQYDLELAAQKVGYQRGTKTARMSFERHVQMGRQALKEGHFTTAIYYFEQAVTSAPGKGRYHALLAQALSRVPQRLRDAEAHYKKAIVLEPARAENYIGLGRLYKQAGLVRRALKQFEETLVWDAENQQAQAEIRALKQYRPVGTSGNAG